MYKRIKDESNCMTYLDFLFSCCNSGSVVKSCETNKKTADETKSSSSGRPRRQSSTRTTISVDNEASPKIKKLPKRKSSVKKEAVNGVNGVNGHHPVGRQDVGDTLNHQWVEIPSVYIDVSLMVDLFHENPIALVSEKLDGSNLCVSSEGFVGSRFVKSIMICLSKLQKYF